jgi:hypothetical protein
MRGHVTEKPPFYERIQKPFCSAMNINSSHNKRVAKRTFPKMLGKQFVENSRLDHRLLLKRIMSMDSIPQNWNCSFVYISSHVEHRMTCEA